MDFLNYLFFLSFFILTTSLICSFIHNFVNYNILSYFFDIYIIFINIIFCFFIYKFIISDWTYSLVLYNTHELDFLLYRILALWSNNEGALLLLCWLLSIFFYIFNIILSKYFVKKILVHLLTFEYIFLFFFNLITFFVFNPFQKIHWYLLEGCEFNILLQDPLFVIHPPILFCGYLGFALVYCYTIILLKYNRFLWYNTKKYYKNILYKLIMFFWMFLTLGIVLGSWWAYYELGWEGWWSWDPVENLSLMPWLLGLMLVHSYHKEKNLDIDQSIYTIFFSFVVFFSSLVSLFFVRSGFLNSVHAFVNDYTSGIFFLILLFFFIFFIINLYYSFNKNFKNFHYIYHIMSEKGLLFYSINLTLLFFVILSFGTFYPIIYNIFTNQDLSLNISFYNDSLKVLMLPFLFLFSIKHITKYNYIYMSIKNLFFIIGSLFIFFLILKLYFNIYNILNIFLLFFSICALFSLFFEITLKKLSGVWLAHFGFILSIINILFFHMFKLEYHINLLPMEKIKLDGLELIFRGYELIKKQIYTSNYGNFIFKWQENTWGLFPEQSFSFFSNALITKSSILTNGLVDCYITVLEDSFNGLIHITFNYMTSFIWGGGFIIICSVFFTLIENKKKREIKLWF